MEKIDVKTQIGFNDSEFVSYLKKHSLFVVKIRAWNESQVTINFNDVIRVVDNDVNGISGFFEIIGDSEVLQHALSRLYENVIPSNHPYKCYQFIDIDDNAALEIVCSSIEIFYS
ncbi:MAG: hypothetical protein G3M70_10160 [Candidatus Nitronauta litoralis]|uniref:Uncharacterized protein n=1 Tax=Candidatus Nitronauta litoralis TaxID=2705533 RepID=A0A7T0BWK6_9BACT|nr:MAG: hypothetical protein G3M70_10160 [Candidatus Nitronauta litoralis]